MRITIELDEGGKPSVQAESTAREAAPDPPTDLAARAAAAGASSAGPAPTEIRAEGPAVFVAEPTAPETAVDETAAASIMSAGAAPGFAAGALATDEVSEVADES